MAVVKISKKCTADILKHVLKIEPKISKSTTWDEAWNILSAAWEFEADLVHTVKEKTVFTLYRDGLLVETYKLGDMWDEAKGDFNYTDIFRTVLDNITKRRLYKRPKLGKRAQKKYDEEVEKAKNSKKKEEPVIEQETTVKKRTRTTKSK